jgi:hypothetical protein
MLCPANVLGVTLRRASPLLLRLLLLTWLLLPSLLLSHWTPGSADILAREDDLSSAGVPSALS